MRSTLPWCGNTHRICLAGAVEKAVDECIKRGVLAEFLEKNRAEAIKVSIYEYDEERHMRQTKEEGFEEGYESGRQSGLVEGHEAGLAEGKTGLIQGRELERKMFKQILLLRRAGRTCEEIAGQCGISAEEVRDMLDGLE